MSGGTTELVIYYAIPLISLVALFTDLVWGRIFNWFTLPVFCLGLVASFYVSGFSGLGTGLLGAVAGLVLFGWLFALRVMGGGDVKLLMALGAWTDPKYVFETAILSILLGGVLAALLLLAKGRLPDFSRRLYRFLLSVFIRELEIQAPVVDRKLTMPFGIPIAIAAVWVLFDHPLQKWGVFPWF
ncbi:MAG TPA: hypothetical protein DCS07_14830 [Bdellovibrionales bacterium]|nr:MAG: hypothetical protein A2Z97_16700 [Bdellovibrionales bacterium GWB1_52_6]OFZ03409.1 MAG: hypothetical protein A2X97_05540 [Bdellovibrionales bacterium GWA1_52_35]HAR43885.1 hypothetical protein [Bdellovibrionales bacterium]HCM40991.1 hypothetical protein [Bdellovibrionales bacterium]